VYEKPFHIEIVTPARTILKGEVTSLSAPGVAGGFQVLYNHAPMISTLGIGEIKVKDSSGKDASYATSGGFVEVKSNKVIVLVETAESASSIDVERARAAKERAATRLSSRSPDVDIARAKAALLRALNRIHIATGSQP
jgi:F-type H+-transporting ATPase subunit epsilon